MLDLLLPFIPIVAIIGVIIIVAILMSGYVKAPPDKAFIISGYRKEPRILIGRAGVKVPFLERKDTLIVKQITVDIKTNGYIPTLDFIGVDIDAVAKIKVNTDAQGIKLAMANFLNMREEDIVTALTDSLQGNMREIIGTVKLKELCTDRKKFGDEVQEKAQKDMNALGIQIISCNIQRIEDEKGLILALGQDNMSQIQKDASIAKALAEKDVAIAEAEAKKVANEAQVKADTDIAEKQNELRIKKAELKKESDIKQAEADAAYSIQNETQRKTIEVTKAEADIARQEKEIELKQREADVKEQELSATIRKKADADKYQEEKKAEVFLHPDEVSLAIGKGGMNIRLATKLTGYTIDVYRDLDEGEEDIYLDEFTDEIDEWVIEQLKNIGLGTAKAVLNASPEKLEQADLEDDTIQHVLDVISEEFED